MSGSKWPEAIARAFDDLFAAVNAARVEDPASFEPVVDRMAELNLTLTRHRVPPEAHASARRRLDDAMSAVAALLRDLRNSKDEIGRAITELRSRRRAVAPVDIRTKRRFDVLS